MDDLPSRRVIANANEGRALVSLARQDLDSGNVSQAIERFERARDLFVSGAEPEFASQVALAAAELLMQTGRYRKALDWLDETCELPELAAAPRRIADARLKASVAATILGQPQSALERVEQARALYEQLGLEAMVARCDLNHGAVLADLGDPRQAIPILEQAQIRCLALGLEEEAADAAVNLGKCHDHLGQVSEALEVIQPAREILAGLGNVRKVASCDLLLGVLLCKKGRAVEGREYLLSARAVYAQLQAPRELVVAEFNLGSCNEKLGDLRAARASYESALRVAESSGLHQEAELVVMNLTRLGQFTGLVQKSEVLGRARGEAPEKGDPLAAARADWHAGAVALGDGQPREAIPLFRRAMQVLAAAGRRRDVAGCRMNLAIALGEVGARAEALAEFEEARREFEELRDLPGLASCELNLGSELQSSGRLDEAFHSLQRARELYRQLGDRQGEADAFSNLGTVLGDKGRLEDALACFQSARGLYLSFGLRRQAADCDANAGIALASIGIEAAAVEHLGRAAQAFEELGADLQEARCEVTLANILIQGDRCEEAKALLRKAMEIFEARGLPLEIARCQAAMAAALRGLGDRPQLLRVGPLREAVEFSEKGLEGFRRLGAEHLAARSEMDLGALNAILGEAKKGMDRIARARETFKRLGYVFDQALANAYLGDTYFRERFYPEAVDAFDEAISLYEGFRSTFWNSASRAALSAKVLHCYRQAMISCLKLGKTFAALSYFERSKARLLADKMAVPAIPGAAEIGEELHRKLEAVFLRLSRQGVLPMIRDNLLGGNELDGSGEASTLHELEQVLHELASKFPDSLFLARLQAAKPQPPSLEQYLDLLEDPRTGLLELGGIFEDRLFLFLVTRKAGLEVLLYPREVAGQLARIWERWSVVYEPGVTLGVKADAVDLCCRELHRLLFGATVGLLGEEAPPNLSLLEHLDERLGPGSSKRLLVVPVGHLFLLPLHAAWCEGGDGRRRYLLEEITFQFSPSAAMLMSLQKRHAAAGERRALVVGDPQPHRYLPKLDRAAQEARAVAAKLRADGWMVDELIGSQATKSHFLDGGGGSEGLHSGVYSHLHLAQHAGVDAETGASLYFADDGSPEAGVCTDREIAACDLSKVDCVIAAACHTSATDPRSMEYLGMASAFLAAGVSTFMGTIYPLSDLGSENLVRKIYDARSRGSSWEEALRSSQLEMAKADSEKNPDIRSLSHPYHWAAFCISGWPRRDHPHTEAASR